jgi:uncharacterized protein YceK
MTKLFVKILLPVGLAVLMAGCAHLETTTTPDEQPLIQDGEQMMKEDKENGMIEEEEMEGEQNEEDEEVDANL